MDDLSNLLTDLYNAGEQLTSMQHSPDLDHSKLGSKLKRSIPVKEKKAASSHDVHISPDPYARYSLTESGSSMHDDITEISSLVNSLDSINFPGFNPSESPLSYKTPKKYNPSLSEIISELENMLSSLHKAHNGQLKDNNPDLLLNNGTLTRDGRPSSASVQVVPEQKCASCNDVITENAVNALGLTWHVEHFICTSCFKSLSSESFYEKNGTIYCESCFQSMFSSKCAHCHEPILDKCLIAMDKNWHPEHFVCCECQRPFDEKKGFHEHEQRPYCPDCFYNLFSPKCVACLLPITSTFISALSGHWHNDCFACQDCHQSFLGGNFFVIDGKPYCEKDYFRQRGTLCDKCQKPVTGRCVNAMHKKFHPEHFICCFCKKQLSGGTFKERNSEAYCHECFTKLFV